MKYLTGEELRKTLGWWLVLSLFAAVVGVTYIRTLDSSPPGSVTSKNNATYDYVIVGGGTAGCVLATRLSGDPRVTVLLLEAGGVETANLLGGGTAGCVLATRLSDYTVLLLEAGREETANLLGRGTAGCVLAARLSDDPRVIVLLLEAGREETANLLGGGTAGCVLATRLSDDPRVTVLLLEGGGEETANLWNHVPLWSPVSNEGEGDWDYMTVPQKYACKAMKNKRCHWPAAKVLGGSSLTNRMLYTRGGIEDFQGWPKDKSGTWTYENILPYYLKSEDMLIEDLKLSDYHSSNGPVPVTAAMPEIEQLQEKFLDAGKELRYKPIDCNSQDNIGFCRLHTTVRDGQRFSTARDYVRTVLARKNLHVSVHSMAIKVLISKNKAVGVEYIRNGKKRTVGANKEVILSGGAVGTAQLLMLSGIGPKPHLDKIGIPVVADLPVGSNLQDHVVLKLDVTVNESIAITRERAFTSLSYLQYFLLGKGVLSTSAGLFGNALIKTDPASTQKTADLQILFSAVTDQLSEPKTRVEGGQIITTNAHSDTSNMTDAFSIYIELLKPGSRGKVRLQNDNPFTPPLIDPNYLSLPKDVQMLIKGIKFATSLLNTDPFKELQAKLYDKPYSPCIQHRIRSDGYWECVVRHLATGNSQSSSTCPLGTPSDKLAVVDTKLKVRGIENLRVADASVLPTSVSADISMTTIMVAEKAADIIRGRDSVRWFRRIAERVTKSKQK